MPCMLDYFPWEILHMTFDFLEPNDLLRAFLEINSHLDTILYSYSRIKLNFISMKKSTFYFICEHIHPEQVRSLFLSDDDHTPGQVKLFMSLLPLIQFINLQSIIIYQIDDANLLNLMLSHLENHAQLQSISIDRHPTNMNNKICRSISQTLASLPSLKSLKFMNSSPLITLRKPLSKLTHLTIHSCTFSDLTIIYHWIPNLLYLQIQSLDSRQTPTFDYVPSYLRSIIIKFDGWILFDEIEALLSHTPLLDRLILEMRGEQALLDGRRWKTLIKTKLPHLTKLALNITPAENTMTGDGVLIPFQDSFWITEKHWHMACSISTRTLSCVRLFSVPYFSPVDRWYPLAEAFYNYSLFPYSFNDSYNELRVSDFSSEDLIPSSFKHIKTLFLDCSNRNSDELQNCIDLSSVNHLKLGMHIQYIPFNDLFQAASNIYQITVDRHGLVQFIRSLLDNQNVYEHIKQLNVEDILSSTDIDQICQTFPKLEHVSLSVKTQDDILRIRNQLQYLTSAIIRWSHPFRRLLPVIDEYLQQNNICTDGTYCFQTSSLRIWID